MNDEAVKRAVEAAVRRILSDRPEEKAGQAIPVEVSGRHVHLCAADVESLFGKNYRLKKKADLSQPGQFLCEERVVLAGPKGQIRNVAVLGPVRGRTQAELSATDCRDMGIVPLLRMSGDLAGAPEIYIMNGMKLVCAEEAAIVAQRHIHMLPADAERFGVVNGDPVRVQIKTQRPVTFENVVVRVSDRSKLSMHIDCDEANACGYSAGTQGILIGKSESDMAGRTPAISDKSDKSDSQTYEKILSAGDVACAAQAGKTVLCITKKTIVTPLALDEIREKGLSVKTL